MSPFRTGRRPRRLIQSPFPSLILIPALAVPCFPAAMAAERIAQYTVEVTVKGHQSWRAGTDWARTDIDEHYRITTRVRSDGELQNVNPRDPAFAEQQIARAAAVQRAVAGKLGPAAPAPRDQAEFMAAHQALAEQAQREQAACGQDTACLMAVATRIAQQSAAIAPPSTPPVDAATDATLLAGSDDPASYRYLHYFGFEGCPTDMQIRIERRSHGEYADVAGMVPWTASYTGTGSGSEVDHRMQCLASGAVYDREADRIHTDGWGLPAIPGRYESQDRMQGHVVNDDARLSGDAEALEWVSSVLRQAPASGSQTTTLVPRAIRSGHAREDARVEGELRVRVDWRFDPG